MTSRERVLTALRRNTPDRVPFDFSFGFSPFQLTKFRRRTGVDDPNEYFGVDTRMVSPGPTRLLTDFSRYYTELPPHAHIDEWGIGHEPTESIEQHHAHLEGFLYPMAHFRTKQDVLDYPLPDLQAAYRFEEPARKIRAIHERGLAALGMLDCTIFEMAWYMRGMERLLTDFFNNVEFAETLLDRITDKRVVQARIFAELGVDVVCFGDDVGTQRGMLMSVSMWRRWLKPRLARVINAARSVRSDILVFYHSDGNILPIIPELIEIGINVLNPVQPECMDPAELKLRYGDRLAFWGTLGTQTTFPFGTPDDVRREVQTRIETVGAGGGLVISPTHMVEPEVPWENILAFVDSVKAFGGYSS
jgi:uroporphyrinogen decarboxylase